jgi:Putative zinc-finger
VRCSLLALSSYIDSELDIEPAGELEAHLLACDRCQTAMGHLREESQRIGGLARVHIPDAAVRELFRQIGLIEEGDDLPIAPPQHERPVSLEAPPWFGAERGKALPWAPRGRYDSPRAGEPRELLGARSRQATVAALPELLLWDEPMDQTVTSAHSAMPPADMVPDPDSGSAVTPGPSTHPPEAAMHPPEPPFAEAPPLGATTGEPQPPAVGISQPQPLQPYAAGAPSPFRKMRDAMAVRLALWRGAGSRGDSGVEIVSGAGAPTWNQRAHPKAWSDSPPVVVASEPPVMEHAVPPPVASREPEPGVESPSDATPIAAHATTPELADVLGEVAMLAAPLGRTPTQLGAVSRPESVDAPLADEVAAASVSAPETIETPVVDELEPSSMSAPETIDTPVTDDPEPGSASAPETVEVPAVEEVARGSMWAPDSVEAPVVDNADLRSMWAPDAIEPAAVDEAPEQLAAVDALVSPSTFRDDPAPSPTPGPGRHVRRLKSERPGRRAWNPTQPVTGRHVLPIGGPAVAAPDRDRRLLVFGAVTAVVMVLGLLIGRQVTQTGRPTVATTHRPTATAPAVAPPTAAPLPVATPVPVTTGPPAPAPQQLTGISNLGTGSSGFTVADVRYGEHPNDFRLVFDLAFPATVTGAPATVVGYFGPTTLYVEFTGVDGTAPVASMPPGQVVVSVVPLPMVRNTGRLIFKITLRHSAPFTAYYLSGARLIIDVT